jgi:hypothetical protein
MGQADLSSSGNLMKPLVLAAIKLAKGKSGDKSKKKAEIKMKQKVAIKVKHG